jgi:hypothetical protein
MRREPAQMLALRGALSIGRGLHQPGFARLRPRGCETQRGRRCESATIHLLIDRQMTLDAYARGHAQADAPPPVKW